ncbi:Transposase DDE domain-containing protein [Puniceibacterium sediminis]|uniref:Transposase DDE domain-containing protein n=1 Tax=Puniceibacterium sediminis TaxID=1608407 RepID=A0A239A4J4_9RHOB|nr:Transposase DDE domain-containing protein [Puniceibacterium sediminis]
MDRGYRGQGVAKTRVLISGMRRGLTDELKAQLRRRSAIEPAIGHMKTDGRLARCPLKGTKGDTIFAMLCGCGHNIRKILARLKVLLVLLFGIVAELTPEA